MYSIWYCTGSKGYVLGDKGGKLTQAVWPTLSTLQSFHPSRGFTYPVLRRDAAGLQTAQFFVAGTALGTEGYLAPLVPLTTSHTIREPIVLPSYWINPKHPTPLLRCPLERQYHSGWEPLPWPHGTNPHSRRCHAWRLIPHVTSSVNISILSRKNRSLLCAPI